MEEDAIANANTNTTQCGEYENFDQMKLRQKAIENETEGDNKKNLKKKIENLRGLNQPTCLAYMYIQ